ncbi:hypothetical protein AAV94_02550 [Lampropedia cohaerens]|uniref:Glycine zipper 2TM domain-containing protein n=1 Tax=Lampropedia cohaerens TaxID=1610491 RepID=A0A0U1Q260_9BURK|nr:glycine zipper 2TM domain-containing protein [Lampropedia cohaerens]KKW68836.1 hypothetical protein AAV94_02550 [Lampropedia cohaerens]
MTIIRTTVLAGSTALALMLAGCQSTPLYPDQRSGQVAVQPTRAPANVTEYGYVTDIQPLQQLDSGSSGAGILLGAVVGGLLGNQVGGGSGRTAATIAGSVGGALAGNTIEGRMNTGGQQGYAQGYRITIRVDNGQYRVYDVPHPGNLQINSRVQVRNGEIAPVN